MVVIKLKILRGENTISSIFWRTPKLYISIKIKRKREKPGTASVSIMCLTMNKRKRKLERKLMKLNKRSRKKYQK
jgi:hypothetical protein